MSKHFRIQPKKCYIHQSMRNATQFKMQSKKVATYVLCVYFYYLIHSCNCYILILMQSSQVYINNQIPIYISNICLIVISYIIILQHQPQMVIKNSKSKKIIYFSISQILDKASLDTRNTT